MAALRRRAGLAAGRNSYITAHAIASIERFSLRRHLRNFLEQPLIRRRRTTLRSVYIPIFFLFLSRRNPFFDQSNFGGFPSYDCALSVIKSLSLFIDYLPCAPAYSCVTLCSSGFYFTIRFGVQIVQCAFSDISRSSTSHEERSFGKT